MNVTQIMGSSLLPLWLSAALAIQGCGGGSSNGPADYTIGGSVSGLLPGASLVLMDNSNDTAHPTELLPVAVNGSFIFFNALSAGATYAVTVNTEPTGQTCLVSEGTGTVASSNVTNIRVLCPSEAVLWTFPASSTGGSGTGGGVIQGSDGNFYGMTASGGANNGGTIFKVTPAGVETDVWSFGSIANDGQEPLAGLVQGSDGNFYGATFYGGTHGAGTVIKITQAGVESVLWSFGGANDGTNPTSNLIQGSDGSYYGTTSGGGVNGTGTVFKVTPAGVETVLWSFGATEADGHNPWCGVIQAADGSLWGTTTKGGVNNLGTVFSVSSAGTETVIWNFGSGKDGSTSYAPLLQASDGNFYGTTQFGGDSNGGIGFKLTAAGVETVLWSFNVNTGEYPVGGLIQGTDGNFYGITAQWGMGSNNGTVFRATPSGEVLALWNEFAYGTGAQAGVIQGGDGSLYGTTLNLGGGITPTPLGIVFRIAF